MAIAGTNLARGLVACWRVAAAGRKFYCGGQAEGGAVLCLPVASSHVAAVAIDGYFEMHTQAVTS